MKKQIIRVALGVIFILTIIFSYVTITIVNATKKLYIVPKPFTYNFVYALDNVKYNINIYNNIVDIEAECIDTCNGYMSPQEYSYSDDNYHKLKDFINKLDSTIKDKEMITKDDLNEYEDKVIIAIIKGEYDFSINI